MRMVMTAGLLCAALLLAVTAAVQADVKNPAQSTPTAVAD